MAGTAGHSGRPRKPIELKRKLGETRPSRVPPRSETVAIASSEGAPVPLSLGPEGREMWGRAQEAVWIGRLDLRILQMLCESIDQRTEMMRLIVEDGLEKEEPIVTPAGMVVGMRKVAHPLVKELRAVNKEIRDIASVLGFDPTARSRLGLAEIKAETKLTELLQRRSATLA